MTDSGARLAHDSFYGRLQFRKSMSEFTLAHRIAEGPPDLVNPHDFICAEADGVIVIPHALRYAF